MFAKVQPGDFQALHAVEQEAVIRIPHAEVVLGRRHFERLVSSIPFYREIVEADSPGAVRHQDRASVKAIRGFEYRSAAVDFEIVRSGRQHQF